MLKSLHVAIGFAGKAVPAATVQQAFRNAGWARYAPNCWIVYTDESPAALVERLRAICDPLDSIFVSELNLENHYGYLQNEIWNWINKISRG